MALTKKQKIIIGTLAALTGLSGAALSSVVIAYESVFTRYERPDYSLKPGQYVIERMPDFERGEIWVQSGENRLKTYVYEAENSKGVVAFAHGIHAGADDYLPLFRYLVDNGYTVVAHNVTGTYESEGESTVGMCQAIIDLESVISYLQAHPDYKDRPLFTMGHSWGGYAAGSVLAIKKGIKACALIAPMRNGVSMMAEKAEQYVGKAALTSQPVFFAYQKLLFKDYVDLDAIVGINATDVPVVIAHGVDDDVITYGKQSVTAHKSKITNPNVIYYTGKGLQGAHDNVWHSVDAAAYQSEVKSDLRLLEIEKGKPLTDDEKRAYYATVDHARYSAVNRELLDKIVKTFDSTLS